MQDYCVLKYREAYNKKGWLWDDLDFRCDKEVSESYKELQPLIAIVIKAAICLTQNERS